MLEYAQNQHFINYFEDFQMWTKIHYYSFVNRQKYPNLFLYYFPSNGILIRGLKEDQRKIMFPYIAEHKESINGMWGYLSTLLDNKNGIELYQILNQSECFDHSISFPCYVEKPCDFDEKLRTKIEKTLLINEPKYKKYLIKFEEYLNECGKEKLNEFHSFPLDINFDSLFAYNKKTVIQLMKAKADKGEIEMNGIIVKFPEFSTPTKDTAVNSDTSFKSFKKNNSSKKSKIYIEDTLFDSNENESDGTYIKELEDIEFLEHVQKVDGYASDYTKRIFTQERKTYFSDDEAKIKSKKQKVHRIKMKGLTHIKNTKLSHKYDKENIGISFGIENNYDKLRKNLQYTRKRKKKDKSSSIKKEIFKINKIINKEKSSKSLNHNKNNSQKKEKNKSVQSSSIDESQDEKNKDSSSISISEFSFNKNKNKINKKVKFGNKNYKNQKILNYIPLVNQISLIKENQIIQNVKKLLSNNNFQEMIFNFESHLEQHEIFIQNILAMRTSFIQKSNEIESSLLFPIENKFANLNLLSDIINENEKEEIFSLYSDSIKKIEIIFFNPSPKNNINALFDKVNENEIISSIKIYETKMKIVVKRFNENSTISPKLFFIISGILNQFSSILIDFLDNKKTDELKMNIFTLLIYTFCIILQLCYLKTKNQNLKLILNKFLCINNLLLLIKLYQQDISKANSERIILITFFILMSEIYSELNELNIKSKSLYMIHLIFNNYLNGRNDMNIIPNSQLIKQIEDDISKFYNPIDTCLFEDKLEERLKNNLRLFFIFTIFKVENSNEISINLRKFLSHYLLMYLLQRFYYVLFLLFADFGKQETDILFYFNNRDYYNCKDLYKLASSFSQKCLDNQKDYTEEYLESDSKLLCLLDLNWKIEPKVKFNYIFELFTILWNNLRNVDNYNCVLTFELYQLITQMFFDFNQNQNKINKNNNPKIVNFLFNISKSINYSLSQEENNQKNLVKIFSKYLDHLNRFKTIIQESINIGKFNQMNIIPLISIISTFVQFVKYFSERKNIEIVNLKIQEIFTSTNDGNIIKYFHLIIWLNLINKISSKQIEMDIAKYINLININIDSLLKLHDKYEKLVEFRQENHYFLEENNEILLSLLLSFKIISQYNPELFWVNTILFQNIKKILQIDIFYPTKLRMELLNIFEILLLKMEDQIKKENDTNIPIDFDGEGLLISAEEMYFMGSINISNIQSKFLLFEKNILSTIIETISIDLKKKSNCSWLSRKNISYTYFEKICLIQSKICGLLTKYDNDYQSFDYPSQILKFYQIFHTIPQNQTFLLNSREQFKQLPFILINEFLISNPYYIQNQITSRDFKTVIQNLIILFLIGLFLIWEKSFKTKEYLYKYFSQNTENEEFCENFITKIKDCQCYIEQNQFYLKNDINKNNGVITEKYREESTYYNILGKISQLEIKDLKPQFLITLINRNNSLEENIEKIESKYIFEILNNDYLIKALESFKQYFKNSEDEIKFDCLLNEIHLLIIEKFGYLYLNATCEHNLMQNIDNFIKKFNNEQNYNKIELLISNKIFWEFFCKILNTVQSLTNNTQFYYTDITYSISRLNQLKNFIKKIGQTMLNKIDIKEIIKKEDLTFENWFPFCEDIKNILTQSNFYYNFLRQLDNINQNSSQIFQPFFLYCCLCSILSNHSSIINIIREINAIFTAINFHNFIVNFENMIILKLILKQLLTFLEVLSYLKILPNREMLKETLILFEYFEMFIIEFYPIEKQNKKGRIIIEKLHRHFTIEYNISSSLFKSNLFNEAITKFQNKNFILEIRQLSLCCFKILQNFCLKNHQYNKRIKLIESLNIILFKNNKNV